MCFGRLKSENVAEQFPERPGGAVDRCDAPVLHFREGGQARFNPAVERGEPFLTPEAQRTLIKDVLERGSSGEEELTPREEEIVKLVAEAHTNEEIGELLFISKKTVERHRANILEKLGMRDRVELTRYAIRRGLVEP